MEFVGNGKTQCFCGGKKCSGFIGEKPIKEVSVGKSKINKKPKKKRDRSSTSSVLTKVEVARPPKRKRGASDDPISAMLEGMKKKFKKDDKNLIISAIKEEYKEVEASEKTN